MRCSKFYYGCSQTALTVSPRKRRLPCFHSRCASAFSALYQHYCGAEFFFHIGMLILRLRRLGRHFLLRMFAVRGIAEVLPAWILASPLTAFSLERFGSADYLQATFGTTACRRQLSSAGADFFFNPNK